MLVHCQHIQELRARSRGQEVTNYRPKRIGHYDGQSDMGKRGCQLTESRDGGDMVSWRIDEKD